MPPVLHVVFLLEGKTTPTTNVYTLLQNTTKTFLQTSEGGPVVVHRGGDKREKLEMGVSETACSMELGSHCKSQERR